MGAPTAIVISSRRNRLRLVCETLTMFSPGYRVYSADDLETASQWLRTIKPSLVAVDARIGDAGEVLDWLAQPGLDSVTTVILGDPDRSVRESADVVVPEPVTVPLLLGGVRKATYSEPAGTQGNGQPQEDVVR